MGCTSVSQRIPTLKLIIFGLDKAGKTSIFKRITNNQFQEWGPTMGVETATMTYNDKLKLLVFDVSGHARSLWSSYLDNVDAVVFVVDVNDVKRVEVARAELKRLDESLQKVTSKENLIQYRAIQNQNQIIMADGGIQVYFLILLNKVDNLSEEKALARRASSISDSAGNKNIGNSKQNMQSNRHEDNNGNQRGSTIIGQSLFQSLGIGQLRNDVIMERCSALTGAGVALGFSKLLKVLQQAHTGYVMQPRLQNLNQSQKLITN